MLRLRLFIAVVAGLSLRNIHGAPLASHIFGPREVAERLDQVTMVDLSRYLLGSSLGYVITEPVFRILWTGQLLTRADWVGIKALTAMRYRINTGRLDDASNMFVYTCRAGWIDVGHVISSALAYKLFYQALGRNLLFDAATFLALEPEDLSLYRRIGPLIRTHGFTRSDDGNIQGRDYWAGYFAMRASVHVEEYQRRLKLKSPRHLWSGNAKSAYTIEDLPSNFIGVQMGTRLGRKTFTKNVVRQFQAEMEAFFKRSGAVDPAQPIKIAGCLPTAGQALAEDATHYTQQAASTFVPRERSGHFDSESVYNFSIRPKRTLAHDCVCDAKNQPRL